MIDPCDPWESLRRDPPTFSAEAIAKMAEEILSHERDYRSRLYGHWKKGLDSLVTLRQVCLTVGQSFQREFLKYDQLNRCPLLHTLMTNHARGVRITAEVTSLLLSGYPDGALARWRTLHEIAVNSLVIQKHGKEAAEAFLAQAVIDHAQAGLAFNSSAVENDVEPLDPQLLKASQDLASALLAKHGEGLKSSNGWARKFEGVAKFGKLQEKLGLKKWGYNYSFASKEIHAGFHHPGTLLGEACQNKAVLLVGPSMMGLTEAACNTAHDIVLITGSFLAATQRHENYSWDHARHAKYLLLMKQLSEDVERQFIACDPDIVPSTRDGDCKPTQGPDTSA